MMNGYVDAVMVAFFVVFMVFVFGGYHKNKSAQRERERELQEKREQEEASIIQ
jgi:Ca2+/Na+ antiporter